LISETKPETTSETDVLPETLIQARIWGARGSTPTPWSEAQRYGGNTPCVEVNFSGGQRIILDAGTGIRRLGLDLMNLKDDELEFHIFLSHFHWDHIQGLPFFPPLYNPAVTVTFYSGRPPEELREILHRQMVTPYFPVLFDDLGASMRFVQLTERPLKLGAVEVNTFALRHPQGANGFRLVHRGKTVVYATDHEHGDVEADGRLLHAALEADVLFYDAQFSPEEYPSHRGWGHGTWAEAVEVAAFAGVKQLVLFHHDPGHDDEQIDSQLARARAIFASTSAAAEGDVFQVR
jgi:phosphoribosyl 1,2-cyclic phosphodiesterase